MIEDKSFLFLAFYFSHKTIIGKVASVLLYLLTHSFVGEEELFRLLRGKKKKKNKKHAQLSKFLTNSPWGGCSLFCNSVHEAEPFGLLTPLFVYYS